MKLLLFTFAALILQLTGSAHAATGQLDLLQPANPTQQAPDSQTVPQQSSEQQQLQQAPDQGQTLQILGDDIDSEPQGGPDWPLWGPWLAVLVTLVLGAIGWLLQRRLQSKA